MFFWNLKTLRTIIVFWALVLFFPATGMTRSLESRHCKGDIEKFCKSSQANEGRVHGCLKSHEAELSPECRARMSHWHSVWGDCAIEVSLYCQNVKGGSRKVHECLKDHESQISDKCRKAGGAK